MIDLSRRLRNRIRRTLVGDLAVLGDHPRPLGETDLVEVKAVFSRPKFFILGHARSGTTLLARLARLHPEVHCNWQGHFFSRRGPIPFLTAPDFEAWFGAASNRWTAEGENSTLFVRLACDFLMERQAASAGKRIVGDKTPHEDGVTSVQWMHAVYPDASLVYIVRDGRDVLVSKRIQAFIDHSDYLGHEDIAIRDTLREQGADYLAAGGSIFTEKELEELSGKWALDVRECHQAGAALFGDRYYALRYEDLLAEPEREMRGLWSHLGAAPADAEALERIGEEMDRNPASEWHTRAAPDLVGGLPRGTPGGWQQVLNNRDRQTIERAAGETLAEWGYLGEGR